MDSGARGMGRWLPSSIAARGAMLVLLVAGFTVLPYLFAQKLLAADERRRSDAGMQAFMVALLDDHVRSAPPGDLAFAAAARKSAPSGGRLRWAGAYDRNGNGVEFFRRCALPVPTILAQVDFDGPAQSYQPLRGMPGVGSDSLQLLTIRSGADDRVFAAVIETSGVPVDRTLPIMLGMLALQCGGLMLAYTWFYVAIVRPLRAFGRRAAALRETLTETALAAGAPAELTELLRSVADTRQQLYRWRKTAGALQHKLDMRVDTITRDAAKALREAEHHAETDALSGLHNRRVLERDLPALFDAQRAALRDLCVIWIDLNNFKNFNDTNGHQAGDALIRFTGELIRASVRRKNDLAVRYGGDEFVLVLPDTTIREASEIAQRFAALFSQYVRTLPAPPPQPSIAAGIANLSHPEAISPRELLRLADAAMYHAKRSGAVFAVAGAIDLMPGERPFTV